MVLNNAQENFTRLDSISPGARVNQMERQAPSHLVAPSLPSRAGRLRLVVGAAAAAHPRLHRPDLPRHTVDGDDPRAASRGPLERPGDLEQLPGRVGAYSELETGTAAAALLAELQARAHPCARVAELRSGLTAISVSRSGRLAGAADPRRDFAATANDVTFCRSMARETRRNDAF